MHADLKGWLVACAVLLAVIALKGCTQDRFIPVHKRGALPEVPAEVITPAKRPPARPPADTPQNEGNTQHAEDRKGWGDEADRSDTKSRILCAERGGKVIDPKTGKNVCDLLKR